METCSSDPTTEKRVRNTPLTISNMLLFNEPRRPTDREPLGHKGLTLGNGSKYTEQSLSDEELFDTEELELNSPIEKFEPGSDGFFKIGDRTLYQAGHTTLRKIQGAAEVATNRLSDWVKPLIPNKLTANGSEEKVIHMLGITYSFTLKELSEINEKYPPEFLKDWKSRLWFTYRTGFPPIRPSDYVSDIGWGCMLRSAQMLLGQALIMLKLGREWRRNPIAFDTQHIYAKIVRLFMDDPNSKAPFSVHKFCDQGRQLGKNIGEWFGPFTASQAMKSLVSSYDPLNLGVYVATDGVIYKDQIRMLTLDTRGNQKPLLVLLPTRLGINTLNPIYFPAIKGLLDLPQSLGIAGGKPSASLYFLAYEGDSLYYLDPHYPRSAIPKKPTDRLTNEELSTYHCNDVRTINIQKIDPCMLFGFFCRDQAEINSFLQRIEEVNTVCEAPILAVARETPMYLSDEDLDTFEEGFEMLNSI